jgi:hypothetical protein
MINNTIFKMDKRLYFSKQDMKCQVYEKILNTTNYYRIQVKTSLSYHFISMRKTTNFNDKTKINSVGDDVEKLYTVGVNVKWCGCHGKRYGNSSQN